eukprot:5781215-Pleurochrysis_carterae.AAC.1
MNCSAPPRKMIVLVSAHLHPLKKLKRSPPTCAQRHRVRGQREPCVRRKRGASRVAARPACCFMLGAQQP